MRKKIRAAVRLCLFFVVSFVTVLLVAIGNLSIGVFNRSWSVEWKNIIIRFWAHLITLVIGLKPEVKGTPPDPPFFFVSNHLSYIDTLLLWRYLDATFVAKSEIKNWPFFGWGTKTLGILFINRELRRDVQRMNKDIAETITPEQGVVIFPEGTSTKGSKVVPFNTSLLQFPAGQGMPVHYGTIVYETNDSEQAAYQSVCWWGDMDFFPHFWNLLKMKKIKGSIVFGESPIINRDRKLLAQDLHKAVRSNFSPMVQPTGKPGKS